MSKEIIDLNNLGIWASAAQICKANKDIFDLCLAVDIHLQLNEKSFDFRGEKVDIVEPNIFIGGKLYDIFTPYNENNIDAMKELFDSLKSLSYEILFRDIMAQTQEYYSDMHRERFYKYGHNYGNIFNAFSERQFGFTINFPHLENDNKTEIVYRNLNNEEIKFESSVAYARHIVENVSEDYYFENKWLLKSLLTPRSVYAFGLDRIDGSGTITTESYKIELGPLSIISLGDNFYYNDIIVTLNGKVLEEGERILYDNSGIIAEIVKDNYEDFLKYAYMASVINALGENVAELYELQKVTEKIKLRRTIQGLLTPNDNTVIKRDKATRRELLQAETIATTEGKLEARKHLKESYNKPRFDSKYTTKSITRSFVDEDGEVVNKVVADEIVRTADIATFQPSKKKIKVRKAIPVSAISADDFNGDEF